MAEFGDVLETGADFAQELDASLSWPESGVLLVDEGEVCFQDTFPAQAGVGVIKVVS